MTGSIPNALFRTIFFNSSAELLGRFNQIEKLLLTNR